LTRCGTRYINASLPNGNNTQSIVSIIPFAVGVTGIALILFLYYFNSWQSFTNAFDVCAQPFCDFVDYYYPMGEAIFHTESPVEGFLYSPFIAILLAVFPPLGLNASLFIWGIMQIFSLILCLLLFRRLVPARIPIQLLFVVLTLSSLPLLLSYIAGQVSVFILATIFGLFFLYERGKYVIAAALLAFAVSFKFFPLFFLVAFIARRDIRFLMFAVIAFCIFLLIVPGVMLGVNNTLSFYGGLFESFRESDWVVTNPHTQFFPHLFLRLVNVTEHDVHTIFPLLHFITYSVVAINIGLIFFVQRARLQNANLWSLQILFLTIPFFLKTSWPHDFFFLPFAQTFLAWQLLKGKKPDSRKYTGRDLSYSNAEPVSIPSQHRILNLLFLILSILVSNVFFFNLLDSFFAYGFIGFLFLANLLLLIATYVELLPAVFHVVTYHFRLPKH